MNVRVQIMLLSVAALGFTACGDDEKTKPPDPPEEVVCTLDSSSPMNIGGIITMSVGPGAAQESQCALQLDVFKAEVNAGCGLLGSATTGQAIETYLKDAQGDPAITPGLVDQLVADHAIAYMVGAGTSTSTAAAAVKALEHNVPMGIYFGTGDTVRGCTDAELADNAITKSATPAYGATTCWDNKKLTLRTTSVATGTGRAVAQYVISAESGLTALTNVGLIYRDDGFGRPTRDGFLRHWAAQSRAAPTAVGYAVNTTAANFKPIIQTLVANNPTLIVGVFFSGELKAFVQAWLELDADAAFTKPSNWSTLPFFLTGSLIANYADAGTPSVNFMNSRMTLSQTFYDKDAPGYSKWMDLVLSVNPDYPGVQFPGEPKTYDALMIWGLAMLKAGSSDALAMAAEVQNVANPPGVVIYPGEFAKARKLILEGVDVDYECAAQSCDMTDNHEGKQSPYLLFDVGTDGAIVQAGLFYLRD